MSEPKNSKMNYIESCVTSVQAIEGYTTIYYRIYCAVESELNAAHLELTPGTTEFLEVFGAAEDAASKIRSRNGLANASSESAALWVFGGSAAAMIPVAALGTLDYPYRDGEHISVGGRVWKCNGGGEVSASHLLQICEASSHPRDFARRKTSTFQDAGSSHPAVTPEGLESGASNAENEAAQFLETMTLFKVYRAYKTAWVSLIGLYMMRRLRMIPLDTSTYSIFSNSWDLSSNFSDLAGKYRQSYYIDVTVRPNGTILTSLVPQITPHIFQRYSMPERLFSGEKSVRDIVIGPYGKRAVALSPSTGDKESYDIFMERVNPSRVSDLMQWKSSIREKLKEREIHLSGLEEDVSWTIVSLRLPSHFIKGENGKKKSQGHYDVTFPWPREICFQHEPSKIRKLVDMFYQESKMALPEPSFRAPEHGFENGFPNIQIDFVLKCLTTDVDSLLATTTKIGDTQENAEDLNRNNPNSQAGEDSLDKQAIDTIYPTPPDLLPSQTSPENQDDQSLASHTFHNASKVQAPIHGAVNETVEDSDQRPEVVGKDSEMHDSDDELFGPEGVSDPDFSFFDEPAREDQDDMEVDSVSLPETSEVSKGIHGSPETIRAGSEESKMALEGMLEIGKSTKIELRNTPVSTGRESGRVTSSSSAASEDSTPPLSPAAVKQQLSSGALEASKSSNLLESISFNAVLDTADRKYLNKGKFSAAKWQGRARPNSNETNLHKTQSLWFNGPSSPNPRAKSEVITEISPHVKKPYDSSSSDDESDDSSSLASDGHKGIVYQRYRRSSAESGVSAQKTDAADKDVSDRASPSVILLDADPLNQEESMNQQLSQSQVEKLITYLFDPRSYRYTEQYQPPLLQDGSDTQDYFPPSSDDRELVDIAQILAEQFAFSTVNAYPVLSSYLSPLLHRDPEIKNLDFPELYTVIGKELWPNRQLDLFSYITSSTDPRPDSSVSDESKTTQAKDRQYRKTALSTSLDAEDRLMKLHCQKVRLQKTESMWEFLPTAAGFWEVLGLGPTNDSKRVLSYCIFPGEGDNEDFVKHFLKSMSSLWNTFKLGSHVVDEDSEEFADGLAKYEKSPDSLPLTDLTKIEEICYKLGQHLATKNLEVDAVVIYIINHSTDPHIVQSLCSCFYTLLQSYLQTTQHMTQTLTGENVVLKVIPSALLEGVDGVGSLSPELGFKLAREVYDRCRPANKEASDESAFMPAYSSIELAERPPKAVVFHLTAGESENILYEAPCLHVCYSQSANKEWVSAAWTDNIGRNQALRSYSCSGDCTLDDVAGEIWNTTLDILRARSYRWQVFVSKSEPLGRLERSKWIKRIESSKAVKPETASFEVTIVSLNTEPQLYIRKDGRESKKVWEKIRQQLRNTDTGTPEARQPGGGAAASVDAVEAYNAIDADPSARLIDLADEAWGTVLAQGLNVFASTDASSHRAVVSGHLLKRISGDDYDPLAVLEVNVMYNTQLSQQQQQQEEEEEEEEEEEAGHGRGNGEADASRQKLSEGLLREVLVMFRGLALLASLRGIEQAHSVRPWHVAVAMKSAEALGRYMKI